MEYKPMNRMYAGSYEPNRSNMPFINMGPMALNPNTRGNPVDRTRPRLGLQ